MNSQLLSQVNIQTQFFRYNPGHTGFTDIGSITSIILPNVIVFSGILLFLLLIYAGYLLIVLGGQNNPPAIVAKSKHMITYAFLGFLLVVSAYFILQIINIVTGVNFIDSPIT